MYKKNCKTSSLRVDVENTRHFEWSVIFSPLPYKRIRFWVHKPALLRGVVGSLIKRRTPRGKKFVNTKTLRFNRFNIVSKFFARTLWHVSLLIHDNPLFPHCWGYALILYEKCRVSGNWVHVVYVNYNITIVSVFVIN